MRRLYRFCHLASLLILLSAGQVVAASPAQQQTDQNGPATIVTLTSSLPFITMKDAEEGSLRTVLSWHTLGLNEDERLVLDRWALDRFIPVMEEGETSLPSSGERDIVVEGTSSFAPPTYRLSVLDFRNRVIDQQTVTVPYIVPTTGDTEITTFVSDVDAVDPETLESGEARVNVTWQIANRPPTANPVFEQVLPDDTVAVIELPRPYLWIPSAGSGTVAPVWPGDTEDITLRLRVVDMVDGTVYAEQTLPLAVQAGAAAPPEAVEAPAAAQIRSFEASPDRVAVGGQISLTWWVENAASVEIAVRANLGAQQTVIAGNLPLSAGLTIPINEGSFAGANMLTFILRARNAEGETLAQQRADVAITR